MKVYLTSIGEKTTDISKWQCEKLGFEVVVLDKIESWATKYKRFIDTAEEDCWRLDADTILNSKVKEIKTDKLALMTQFLVFSCYKNDIKVGSPVFYKKEAIQIIKDNFYKIDLRRPEANAWRLDELIGKRQTIEIILGMTGFFQDKETIMRAKQNKEDRGQLNEYDFELVNKLYEI